MRVIGGEFRSRVLKSLPGAALRPTPDLLRQALFNVVGESVAGAVFLDAYAGSGAVGIEALSRGARRAIFIERHPAAVRLIWENLAALGITERAFVLQGPVVALLDRQQADIVFLDPPYPLEREYRAALKALGEHPPALVLVQHSKRFEPGDRHGALARTRKLAHGDNVVSFYTPDT